MSASPLVPSVGVGFKQQHYEGLTNEAGPVRFFEVHAENYMGAGGLPHAMLRHLRAKYSLSVHGVGLSIGGAGPLDTEHLQRLKLLCDSYQPNSVSEHLAWSSHNGAFLNDLLPVPYTQQTLQNVIQHVDQVQSTLKRQLLLENPATYLRFSHSTIPETEFLKAVAEQTGCGLLLDINNVYVSSINHGSCPRAYLNAFPLHLVGEIHLGGHSTETDDVGAPLLIDTHGAAVAEPVWALYADTLAKTGPIATLIEWDTDVPTWPVLLSEVERAAAIMSRPAAHHAA